MTDVVVPILGNSIEVPDLLRPFYEELLIKDDLTMDCFNTSGNGTRINIQYEMAGMYRKMIQNPHGFEYNIKKYSDMNEDLYNTELSSLYTNTHNTATTTTTTTTATGTPTATEHKESQYIGLHVGFSLPPGTYATMMLRELMKCGTETLFHVKLTAATATANASSGGGSANATVSSGDAVDSKEDIVVAVTAVEGACDGQASKRPRLE